MSHDFPNPQNPHPQAQHHGSAAPHGAADLSALGPHGTPEHYETHQVYEHLPTEPSRPSAQVRLGIKLIYAHAVLIVVHGVVSFYRDTIPTSTTVYAQHGAAAMDVTIGKIAVLYAVITLVLVATNILVGVFYSRGYTWARITAAVLAILGAMNNLLLGLLTLIGVFELFAALSRASDSADPGYIEAYRYATIFVVASAVLYLVGLLLCIIIAVYMFKPQVAAFTTNWGMWRAYQRNPSMYVHIPPAHF